MFQPSCSRQATGRRFTGPKGSVIRSGRCLGRPCVAHRAAADPRSQATRSPRGRVQRIGGHGTAVDGAFTGLALVLLVAWPRRSSRPWRFGPPSVHRASPTLFRNVSSALPGSPCPAPPYDARGGYRHHIEGVERQTRRRRGCFCTTVGSMTAHDLARLFWADLAGRVGEFTCYWPHVHCAARRWPKTTSPSMPAAPDELAPLVRNCGRDPPGRTVAAPAETTA